MGKTLREFSRDEWSSKSGNSATVGEIKAGALQRIAGALELHNKDIVKTIAEKDELGRELQKTKDELKKVQDREKRTETYWRNAQAYAAKKERSLNGLRGYVGKLKKKLAAK